MSPRVLGWALCGAFFFVVGCDSAPAADAGSVDMGRGDGGSIIRSDAGPDTGSPVVADAGGDSGVGLGRCDPAMTGSCPSGQKCSLVVVAGPTLPDGGPGDASVFFDCVPVGNVLQPGNRCGGFEITVSPGVRTDACPQGTLCLAPISTGLVARCLPLCSLGTTGAPMCGADAVCVRRNSDPAFGLCDPGKSCDPIRQTGCTGARQGCYVLPNTADRLVSACLDFTANADAGVTGQPGDACQFIDSCAPGSGCFQEIDGDGGFTGDALCREFCDPSGSGGGTVDAGPVDTGAADAGPGDSGPIDTGAEDAGAMDSGPGDAGPADLGPADAGPPDAGPVRTGRCPSGQRCVRIPTAGAPVGFSGQLGLCQF